MTVSRPGRLAALALLALSCAWGVVGVVFAILLGSTDDIIFTSGQAVLAAGYPAVGALIAARQPRNPCAWILIAVGLFQGISAGGYAYSQYAEQLQRDWLLTQTMFWVSNWIWFPSLGLLITVLLQLFPNGRLPSRRWRPVGVLTVAFLFVSTAATAYFAAVPEDRISGPAASYEGLLFAGLVALGLVSVASLIVRFRRSRGIERQQLKWLALGGTGVVVGVWSTFLAEASPPLLAVTIVLMLGFPASIGVAILRHRLFDIDRIISRAVSYALLTALLLGIYAAGVVALRPLLQPLVGESQLAIAMSTITAAAAFQPARRRIQAVVDRRFNRARYDAGLVVDQFTARLRTQVDLDELALELHGVVTQTVQPARVALWLRPDTATDSPAALT